MWRNSELVCGAQGFWEIFWIKKIMAFKGECGRDQNRIYS